MNNKKGRILFVEDDKVDRMAFVRCADKLEFPYNYVIAGSVKKAGNILESEKFDAVVTDYLLEDGTAFDLFKKAGKSPIIIVTGTGDEELAVKVMKAGAYDYLSKDPNGNYLKTLSITVEKAITRKIDDLEIKKYRVHLEKQIEDRTVELHREIREHKKAKEHSRQNLEKLNRVLGETVDALASALEKRDAYTAGHQHRVSQLAQAVGRTMNLSQEQIEGIRIAGTLHDIGKICVPAEILVKPGQLNEVEFNIIKIHSQAGYEILKGIEFDWPIAQAVLQHHERLNGSGYPKGISGQEIILDAKILAVADTIEAMSSQRPYRPALGIDCALEEISRNKDVLYDHDVVNIVLRLFAQNDFKFK